VDEILDLLSRLNSKGIKLSVKDDGLLCYAPRGVLTKETVNCIAQNKAKIIARLSDYIDCQVHTSRPAAEAREGEAVDRSAQRIRRAQPLPQTAPPVDLKAEAVLDPDIQPVAGSNGGVDFSSVRVAFLTGASGFLGAYLLDELLQVTTASVHCLVRCQSENNGFGRIKQNLEKYGLWNEKHASRIVPVPGDLSLPRLGLRPAEFDRLSDVVDTVYHSGAVVNFIYSYSVLKKSNVHGTGEVLRLATRMRAKPLHYVSTIAVVPPGLTRDARIGERDHPSEWQGLIGGYPQSKWVAEILVRTALDRGVPIRIYRPGFVTGDSVSGVWNTTDFIARMIKGCIQLGMGPDVETMLELVPVDYVSKAIVHLSRQRELESGVFHLVGPNALPMRELFRMISLLGYKVDLVSYEEWRDALFENSNRASSNALNPLLAGLTDGPALQMPAFDRRFTLEGLRGTQVTSPEITTDIIDTYLQYFKKSGFMNA
jgi:myxalamid-type nonribosomal peptide synthetase MxaA